MLLLLLNYVVLRALWTIDVHLISTLVNKSLYYYYYYYYIPLYLRATKYFSNIVPVDYLGNRTQTYSLVIIYSSSSRSLTRPVQRYHILKSLNII